MTAAPKTETTEPSEAAGEEWSALGNAIGEGLRAPLQAFLLSVGVAIAQIWVTWAYLSAQISLTEVGFVHGACVLVISAWCGLVYRSEGWSRAGFLMLTTTAFMGPFGAVGTVYALLVYLWFRKEARPFEEWYYNLFPPEEKDTAQALYEHIVSGREELDERTSVVSFSDVMSFGSFEQKLAVLTLVTKHFRPEFSKILNAALVDDSAAVRVRAATAKAEIDNRYLERAMSLTARLEKEPEAAQAHFDYARYLDEHAFSGLVAKEQASSLRAKSLHHYGITLKLDPLKREAVLPLIRGHLRDGEASKAREWIKRAREIGISLPQLDDWEMECAYLEKDYAALRQIAKKHYSRQKGDTNPTRIMGEIVRIWSGEEALPSQSAPTGTPGAS